jgi:phospholipase/carboxylesterase
MLYQRNSSFMSDFETIQMETGNNPDAAVIWLHGLGANGNDFVPIVKQLHLPEDLSIRFIFPHAPDRPITINQGMQMPGWYDIRSLSIVDGEDEQGINVSSTAISKLCESQEKQGIAAERIILAGFSQGGAIALHCALNYPKSLGGVMALSTYLPQCSNLETSGNLNISVFMAHGSDDDVVAPGFGKQSRQRLQDAGCKVIWHEYPMAHSVCTEEVQDISDWLQTCLV